MSISLADLNRPAWPLRWNFMGLKAVDALIERAANKPASASPVFLALVAKPERLFTKRAPRSCMQFALKQ
jgi:hypothetical protein